MGSKEKKKTKQNKTKQNKTKRNKTKQNKTKRNETKRNETKRNETKRNKTKQNKTKQNKTKNKQTKTNKKKTDFFSISCISFLLVKVEKNTRNWKEISGLEEKINNGDNSPNICKDYTATKSRVEHYYRQKCKGASIRARVKWFEEGERNTKCFLSLEKNNGIRKQLTKLKMKRMKQWQMKKKY